MADLRFGTFLAPSVQRVYQTVVDAVARQLELDTELVVETSYDDYYRDRSDVSFICSLPYVMAERRGESPAVAIAAPVLSGSRYRGAPVYFSDVIVHRDSPVQGFLDLRGRSWAFNERLSHSGYGVTRYSLLEMGETSGFFGDVIEAGYHQESMRMVAGGEVDASAIDSQVLAVALRDDPALRRNLRVIATLGPSTIQPVVVSKRLDPELRARIAGVLYALHKDPEYETGLSAGFVQRFVPADLSSYADIVQMLEACEQAGFLELE